MGEQTETDIYEESLRVARQRLAECRSRFVLDWRAIRDLIVEMDLPEVSGEPSERDRQREERPDA